MRAPETRHQDRSRTTSLSRNSCCHQGPTQPRRNRAIRPGSVARSARRPTWTWPSPTDRSQTDRSRTDRSRIDRSRIDRSRTDRSAIDRSPPDQSPARHPPRRHPGCRPRHCRHFGAAVAAGDCRQSRCPRSAPCHARAHRTNPTARSVRRAARRLRQQPAAAVSPPCPRSSPRPDLSALLLLWLLRCAALRCAAPHKRARYRR